MSERCGVAHYWSGPNYTCIRPKGHDGLCWGKYQRIGGGCIQRAEWVSRDGAFYRHDHYRARRPSNTATEPPTPERTP